MMNYNKLSRKAHDNAVKHGFWANKPSKEHCMMLVITEIAEMVEADRTDKKAEKFGFDTAMKNAYKGVIRQDWFDKAFRSCIKNTLEDEMADVAIRLFDLAGDLGVDFTKMQPCRYFRAFDRFTFTENAFGLAKGLSHDKIAIEKRIQFGLSYVEGWAKTLKIDLAWHIEQKMKFNEGRPVLHGKAY